MRVVDLNFNDTLVVYLTATGMDSLKTYVLSLVGSVNNLSLADKIIQEYLSEIEVVSEDGVAYWKWRTQFHEFLNLIQELPQGLSLEDLVKDLNFTVELPGEAATYRNWYPSGDISVLPCSDQIQEQPPLPTGLSPIQERLKAFPRAVNISVWASETKRPLPVSELGLANQDEVIIFWGIDNVIRLARKGTVASGVCLYSLSDVGVPETSIEARFVPYEEILDLVDCWVPDTYARYVEIAGQLGISVD